MKDNVALARASDPFAPDMDITPSDPPEAGMRHSIRPRRAIIQKVQKQQLEQAFSVHYESRFVPASTDENLTSPAIVNRDVPRWEDLARDNAGDARALSSAMPVVDAARDSAAVRSFDLLRTRLRQTTQEHGWVNIAVTAPTGRCGNTFTAVNLALSLSRIPGSRTVLMDMNLRNPGVARAFDMTPRGAMRDYLDGTVPLRDHMVRASDTLVLGLNDDGHADAADTLQNPATPRTLERMRAALRPDLVIYDMPAMLVHDDVSAFLPHLDGVLLVSDGTQTMGKQLVECERMLDGQVPLLGVVLNRARKSSVARYS